MQSRNPSLLQASENFSRRREFALTPPETEIQEAIVAVLVCKTLLAAKTYDVDLQKELGPRYMTRFRELIFITPDVNRNMFTEQILPALRTTGVKLTVFTSDRDKKLMESHQERAGLRLGDPLLGSFLKGVHFIDASAVDTSMVGKPYYVKKGTVYEDIKEIISAP